MFDLLFVLDINECSTGNDDCHINATCLNTEGSFTCSCNMGYTGNGRDCAGTLFYWVTEVVTSNFKFGLFVETAFMYFIMAVILKVCS